MSCQTIHPPVLYEGIGGPRYPIYEVRAIPLIFVPTGILDRAARYLGAHIIIFTGPSGWFLYVYRLAGIDTTYMIATTTLSCNHSIHYIKPEPHIIILR